MALQFVHDCTLVNLSALHHLLATYTPILNDRKLQAVSFSVNVCFVVLLSFNFLDRMDPISDTHE